MKFIHCQQAPLFVGFLKDAVNLMNRLGVLEVNNALMAFFERGNDLFESTRMMVNLTPKHHNVRIEHIVRQSIDNAFDGFIHNKIMDNAPEYHLRRIDHRLLIGNTILAIETDENAHRSYKAEHEKQRYTEFISVFPYQFVFIRFNPHDNREKDDCKSSLEYKLSVLIKTIRDQMKRIEKMQNNHKLEIIWLFY